MKIGTRLSFGFGLSILLTIIVGSFALSEMQILADLTNRMHHHPLAVSNAVRDIRADIIAMHRSMKDIALAESIEQINTASTIVNQYEQQVYFNFYIVFERFLGDLSEVKYAQQMFSEWKVIRDEIIGLRKQGKKNEAAHIARDRGTRHIEYMMDGIEEMINFAAKKSDKFLFDTDREIIKTKTVLSVLLSAMVILGFISSILITRSIVKPLGIIVEKIKNLSQGSLRDKVSIHSNDEVGVLANSFRELQQDIAQRSRILEQIASGDFSTDRPPRSEKDDIGKSFFAMTTSLRETTKALNSSEEKFSYLLMSVPAGISVSTPEDRIIEANNAIIEMFGFDSKEEFISYPAIEYYYNPDDRNRYIEAHKKGQIKNFELQVKRKDGTFFWGSVTSITQTTEKYGTLLINSIIDISGRIESEKALKKESSFVSLLREIAVTANESSTIEKAMQVCLDEVCTLMDWPVGHVYMPSGDKTGVLIPTGLWHLENPEKFRSFREVTGKSTFEPGIGLPGRIMASKLPAWITDVNNDPNFTRGEFVEDLGVKAAFGFPVLLGTEVVAVLEFYAKTEEKPDNKLLEVMSNIGQQLGRVAERSRSEKKLKDAIIEAELANKAKSIFLANMSHELRTPLNAILGFSQVLELDKENFNGEQLEHLGYIRESGNHLLEMVSDILDLSKIESGKMEIEKKSFNLYNTLVYFPATINTITDEKGIKLETDIDPSLSIIGADEKRIKEILYNLLSNAIKFTESGKKVGIKAWLKGETVIIEVWDQGRGIEHKDMEKIFDPFEQVGKATQGNSKGTGLGLAITKKLIEAHDGILSVESKPGEGSSFRVTLPRGIG